MPRKLELKLKREARKKFPNNKERQDAYVYGTMNKLGLLGDGKKKEDKKE